MLLAGSARSISAAEPLLACSAPTPGGDGTRGQGHPGHPPPPRLEKTFFIKALSLNALHFLIPWP
jgi:hypothetical protein